MPSGLSESLGTSFGPLGAYAFAAGVVLALLLIVLFVAKRAMGGTSAITGARKGPRLAVIDVAAIDQRRKLVLVRRDEVEHLMLVGGENDVVVEAGILRVPSALRPGSNTVRTEPEMAAGDQQRSYVAAIAPEPRVRPPSPLRRNVPPSTQRVATDIEADRENVPERFPVETRDDAAPDPIVPKPDAAPVVAAARDPDRPPPQETQRQPVATPLPSQAATPNPTPVVEPSARSVSEIEPRVPEFLRRTDAPAVTTQSAPPAAAGVPTPVEPRRPIAVEAPAERVEPPARIGEPRNETSVRPDQESVRRVEGSRPPVVGPNDAPASRQQAPAPFVQPHAPVPSASVTSPQPRDPSQPVPASAARSQPQPQPQPQDGGNEPAERQPLSVRSFASTIQQRRPPEPVRQAPAAPPPVQRPQQGAPVQGNAVPPSSQARPAEPRSPEPTRAKETDLDEALSRGLDDDFRSLDWNGERGNPPPPPVRPDAPLARPQTLPAPVADAPKAERRPTLEEEMERLLGDFDFNANKR